MNIKIFGERNTSTNALREIILGNSTSTVFPGTAGELDEQAIKRMRRLRRQNAPVEEIEAVIDGVFRGRSEVEQWKHAAPTFDDVSAFRGVHLVFTVRHPLSWLSSLYKSPYNSLVELPDTLIAFMRCDWRTVERERLGGASFKPLELYEKKLRTYRILASKLDAAGLSYTVLKFEDIVMHQTDSFRVLAPFLDNPAETFTPLTRSTKAKSGKTLEDYIAYYRAERWRDDIPVAVAREFRFDATLMQWLGYT